MGVNNVNNVSRVFDAVKLVTSAINLPFHLYFNTKRQLQKMVTQTQTISRQKPTNCLNVFDHFLELAFKRLSDYWIIFNLLTPSVPFQLQVCLSMYDILVDTRS